jgi:hypothetical protein
MSQLDEFKKLEQLVKDIYLIADPGVIKFLCCCIISHRLPADPTWSFLVSPPSGGKTELLNCLTKVKGIYPLSSLTPHTFLSGQKRAGKETSLLTRLQNAILTFKDFTTVLSMQPDARNELYGQFREIYDGKMSKEFGTGETKTWKGKISFLAGVTTEIHLARELYSSMGERFALYQIIQPDRMAGMEVAMKNAREMNMPEIREKLQDDFKYFLDEVIKMPEKNPQLPKEIEDYLKKLSDLSTRAGTRVVRDPRSNTKEISFVHDATMPFRFATQLITYGMSLMVLNDGPMLPEDEHILFKIALDSIDKSRRMVLQELTKYTDVTTSGLATALHRPTTTIRRICEDLDALEMLDRTKQSNKDVWALKDEFKETMSRFEGIEMLNTKLTDEPEAEDAPLPMDDLQQAFPGSEVV